MLYLEVEWFELNTRGGVLTMSLVTSVGVFSDATNELPLLLPFPPFDHFEASGCCSTNGDLTNFLTGPSDGLRVEIHPQNIPPPLDKPPSNFVREINRVALVRATCDVSSWAVLDFYRF